MTRAGIHTRIQHLAALTPARIALLYGLVLLCATATYILLGVTEPWEYVGLVAGTTVVVSGLPQIARSSQLLLQGETDNQSISRNLAYAAGNGLWVAYGLGGSITGSFDVRVSVAVFCTIAMVLGILMALLTYASQPKA